MDLPNRHKVEVVNETKFRVKTTPIKEAVSMALALHHPQDAEVCVLLTDDDRISALNRTYRKIDEPTDVLSFPGGDFPNAPLGDIAISVPYAKRQAQARGAEVDTEICYLAIHGCLHLCGFDDEEPSAREQMVKEMNRVGIALGLPEDSDWSSILHSGDEDE